MKDIISAKELHKMLEYPDIDGFNDIFDVNVYAPTFVHFSCAWTFDQLYLLYNVLVHAYEEIIITKNIQSPSEIFIYCEYKDRKERS